MAKRVKPGDVVEIPTSKGLAYAQVILKDNQWGALLRIVPELHKERPSDFSLLLQQAETFKVFFPLGAAVHRGIFEIVANGAIPDSSKGMPVFRSAGHIDRTGRVHFWWIEDGKNYHKVGKLSQQQKKLPLLEVINDTLLIERIEQGWTPETDRRSQDGEELGWMEKLVSIIRNLFLDPLG